MCGLPTVVMLPCGVVTMVGAVGSQVGGVGLGLGSGVRIRLGRRRHDHRRRQDAEHDRVALLGARAAVVGGDDGEREDRLRLRQRLRRAELQLARERTVGADGGAVGQRAARRRARPRWRWCRRRAAAPPRRACGRDRAWCPRPPASGTRSDRRRPRRRMRTASEALHAVDGGEEVEVWSPRSEASGVQRNIASPLAYGRDRRQDAGARSVMSRSES